MKDELLSIADYLESLEQRVAALESANIALQDTINNLQDQLDSLPVREDEPEVEVELIMPEDEPEQEPEPEPVVIPEPEPEPEPEPVVQPAPCHLPPVSEPSLFGPQVENIRQAISLGDRFLFQRELFQNNGELMQKTLDEINDCHSIEEALQHVAHFNWDQETTTYKLFLNVLKRRF